MTTNAPQGPKPDLDTQIREAEQRVIAADRDWQRHTESLSASVRGHAGRAATLGGLGVASTIAGALLLRWRLGVRSKARDKLLVRMLAKLGWPRGAAAPAADALHKLPRSLPPPLRSPALMSVLATVGTLLGAAARTGLKLPAKPGVTSMVMGVLMPMLTRWLRSRSRPTPPTAAPGTPGRPTPPTQRPRLPPPGPRPG